MKNTFNPDYVNTVEEMVHHLWHANCSVCSKIASKLADLSVEEQVFVKHHNQVLNLAIETIKGVMRDLTGNEVRPQERVWNGALVAAIMSVGELRIKEA
jgi:coenzyme F420-reducing hydrogenase beta subunit